LNDSEWKLNFMEIVFRFRLKIVQMLTQFIYFQCPIIYYRLQPEIRCRILLMILYWIEYFTQFFSTLASSFSKELATFNLKVVNFEDSQN